MVYCVAVRTSCRNRTRRSPASSGSDDWPPRFRTTARLEYHLVSRTGNREIVLLKANGQPPPRTARAQFEIPQNPNVAGTWIDCREAAIYRLIPGGAFEVISMDNPLPVHAGSWRERENKVVDLSATGGLVASYTLFEDIELRGNTHSLWRGL